jgi:hypothetical protein
MRPAAVAAGGASGETPAVTPTAPKPGSALAPVVG